MANEFKVKNGLVVSGSADIQQDLRVRGILTVDELHTSITSASVLFESGSTIFGNDVEDIHQFTGSLNISGSILLNGTTVGTGKLDETTFNSFTSSYISNSGSFDDRLDNLESFSSSLDTSFVSETEFGNHSSSINSFTSSIDGRVDSLETESGSIRGNFNSFTSSYNSASSSFDTRINSLETLSGSFTGSFTGSFIGDGTNLYNIPASGVTGLNLTQIADGSVTASVSNANGLRVNSKAEVTGSLIVTDGITGSIDYTNITNKPTLVSGSSQILITGTTGYSAFSSSVSSSIGALSSSIGTTTNDLDGRLDNVETSTGSLNSFTSSINTTIKNKLNTDGVISGSVQVDITGTTGYSEFSSSVSSSINSLSSSFNTTNNTQNGRIDSLESESGSVRTAFNSYTSSNDSTNTTQNSRLTSIENKTGSYATTGSNTFVGSQTISGSVIIRENLTVLGSSSITYTTSSQLRVDDNVIVVNTSNPAERFGGLQVYDSGSIGEATGSLFWDSEKNRWIYQQSSESTYGGGVLLSGPRSSGSLGDELTLTSGKIARSAGGDHLNDSIITEYSGTTIGINGALEVTGSIISSITPLVSGSAQIDLTATTNYVSGIKTRLNSEGVISGSSQVLNGSGIVSSSIQIVYSGVTGIPSGIVSGSGQIVYSGITNIPSGIVSGSSQIVYSGITGIPSGIVSGSSQVLNGSGIWSGSAQLPSGVVSGSGQIDHNTTTNYVANQHIDHTAVSITAGNGLSGGGDISATRTLTLDTGSLHLQNGIKSYLNGQSVVSSSAQILAGTTIHSGSFFNGISVVSGSSQISFGGISGVPSGLVSGSSQVLGGTTIHSGSFFNGISVVSGSAQISFGGIAGVPSGLVSGSSQISFGSVSGVPSGLVSGSSQITLSSTSGFGSYLNQAVLTTSSPTFDSPVISGVVSHNTSSSRNKFNVYGSGASAYAIGMQSAITYGGLNDWGMTFQFNNDGSRGFWWGDDAHSTAQGAMALTTDGALTVARKIRVGYGESDVITPTLPLQVYGSGGTIVDIQGASGQLFSVTDDLTGDIFSVSDISGMPLLNVNTTTGTGFGYTAFPLVNNLYDLGTSALRWANVYTNDLHLSNEGKVGGNDIDGTTGDWTIQEGAEKLYIINNKNGKKYKIDLTEVE